MNMILRYNQAKYAIFDIIAKKHLKVGDRLPSLWDMCDAFPYSATSFRRALQDLQDQGILNKIQGSGTYLMREIDQWEQKGELFFIQIDPERVTDTKEIYPLKQYLRERNFTLHTMICSKPDSDILKKMHGSNGLFVTGLITREWTELLAASGLPVLYIGTNECTQKLPCLDYDWEKAVHLAMERLIHSGCRKIALINGDCLYYPAQIIAKVFIAAAKKYKLPLDISDIFWKPAYDVSGIPGFLRQKNDYDAFLLEQGALSHVLIAFRQHNLAENCKLSVLGRFDNNVSDDKITFVAFQSNLFLDAGRIFFEWMKNPDMFANGARLVQPLIV